MHETAESFRQEVKKKFNTDIEIQEFPEGTKTAQDAANAIGCEISQIVKSIVMEVDGNPLILLTAGNNRVSKQKLADHLGIQKNKITSADPELVKSSTGWSIGGVPPFCHDESLDVLVDEELLKHEELWAAAGTPEAVFPISPGKLERLSGAEQADVFE